MNRAGLLKIFSTVDISLPRAFRKELIWAALMVIVSVAFYRLGYVYMGKQTVSTEARARQTAAEIARITSEAQGAEGLRLAVAEASSRLTGIEAKLKGISEKLPADRQVSKLLSEISEEGATNGVRIVAVKPMPSEEKNGVVRLRLQVTLEGRYADIGDYFERIENLPRLISVDNFMFEPKVENSNLLTAQVYLSAYYLGKGM